MVITPWCKHILLTAFASIISFYLSLHLFAQGTLSDQNSLSFLFAAGAQIAKGENSKAVPVEDGGVLSSGDRIKFFLKTKSDGYFYLFHISPNGNIAILFPQNPRKAHVSSGQEFYIPKGLLWFELDDPGGFEKFIFLASKSRLSNLEDLSTRYTDLKDRSEIHSSTQAILEEISHITKQHRSMAGPAERPVRMAGRIRDESKTDSTALPDIAPFAKEIFAQGFYSKTFTIEHR